MADDTIIEVFDDFSLETSDAGIELQEGSSLIAVEPDSTSIDVAVDGFVGANSLRHRGNWEPAEAYLAGDVVTAYGVLWRCTSAHTSTGRHLDETKFVKMTGPQTWNIGSLALIGHSYVDTGDMDMGNTGRKYFPARLASSLGLGPNQIKNIAVSGTTARWHAYLTLQEFNPGIKTSGQLQAEVGMSVIWYGGNDSIMGYADDTWAEWTYKSGYKSIIARMRAGAVMENTHASIDYDGTFVEVDYLDVYNYKPGSGDSVRVSDQVGDKIVITTPNWVGVHKEGVWIQLGFLGGTSGAAATVKVDGVLDGNLNAGRGTAYGTAMASGDSQLTPYVYRLWLPTVHTDANHYYTQEHTIEIEITGVTGDGLMFDFWAVEADDPPLTLCLSTVSPSNARSIWASLANTAVVEKYNEWLEEVIAEFTDPTGDAQDETVRYVDVNYVIGGYPGTWSTFSNEKYFGNDGLHPSPIGGQLIAEAVLQEIDNAMHSGVTNRNLLGVSTFERDPIYLTPRVYRSTYGAPVAPLDTYDREVNDLDIGNPNAIPVTGCWGIGIAGKAKIVDSAFTNIFEFADDFQRANSATLGDLEYSADGDVPTWTAVEGTWEIVSHKAKLTNVGSAPGIYPHAIFDTGSTEHWIEATMTTVSGNVDVGILVRYYDDENYIFFTYNGFGVGILYKSVGGTLTAVDTGSSTNTPRIEVDAAHNVKVFNGTGGELSLSYAIPNDGPHAPLRDASATKVGLWGNNVANVQFDSVRAGTTLTDPGIVDWGFDFLSYDVGKSDGGFGIVVGDDESGIPPYYGFAWRVEDEDNYMRAIYDSEVFGAWVITKYVAGALDETWAYWTNAKAGDEIVVEHRGDEITFWKNGVQVIEFYSLDYTVVETNPSLTGTLCGPTANKTIDNPPPARWEAFLFGDEMMGTPRRGDMYVNGSVPTETVLYGPYDRLDNNGWGTGVDITPDVIDGGEL